MERESASAFSQDCNCERDCSLLGRECPQSSDKPTDQHRAFVAVHGIVSSVPSFVSSARPLVRPFSAPSLIPPPCWRARVASSVLECVLRELNMPVQPTITCSAFSWQRMPSDTSFTCCLGHRQLFLRKLWFIPCSGGIVFGAAIDLVCAVGVPSIPIKRPGKLCGLQTGGRRQAIAIHLFLLALALACRRHN